MNNNLKRNQYRITTNGNCFRVEILLKWTSRAGFLWLKKVSEEKWIPCDFIGQDATDDDGMLDESEIIEYDTVQKARDAIAEFQTDSTTHEWRVVN
jgi:hypothetical protein